MRRIFPRRILTAALGALFLVAVPGNTQAPRERQLFDSGWRFHLGDVNQGQSTALADKSWRQVDLPHDWSIEGPYSAKNASGTGFLPGGIGWYRKTFQLPVSLRGRKVPSGSMAYIAIARLDQRRAAWLAALRVFHLRVRPDAAPPSGRCSKRPGGARGPQRRGRLAMLSRVGHLSPRLAQCHRTRPHRDRGSPTSPRRLPATRRRWCPLRRGS